MRLSIKFIKFRYIKQFHPVPMNSSWLKPNLYVVQNGKLVARPTTPEQKKNYRYIHYEPLNNPAPDDYFRETISRLQKENSALKAELASKLEEESSKTRLHSSHSNADSIRHYEAQIATLIQELASKEHELQEKNQQLTSKDKRILELSNQNTRLHLRINSVVKQIEALNLVMSKKDEQILNKKEQIQEYCRTLEKFTIREKEEEKTMFSENYLTTPRIEEKGEEEDEFYSIQYGSVNDRHSLDHRFMTPSIQGFKIDAAQGHLHRSQQQINIQEHNFQSTKSSRISSEEDKKAVQGKELNWSLKNWSQWASQPNIKGSISFDLLREEVDPAAGGLSSMLSGRK